MFLFSAKDQYFALDLDKVQEVAEPRQVVAVPRAGSYVRGAMNYKGSLYCIIDTLSFFGVGSLDVTQCDIIILSDKEYKVGFLAENITGAVEPPKSVTDSKERLVKGYFTRNDNKVRIIDTKEALSTIENNINDNNITKT